MATARTIKLDPRQTLILSVPDLTQSSADKASQLLQENHTKHHIYFDKFHKHNHIVHHLVTLYALGATPQQLERQYQNNESYQKSSGSFNASIVAELDTPAGFTKYLGASNDMHWREWLAFWEAKVDALGWQETLRTYVFKGDARADDMLYRMFGGVFHPLLHLGFAVEAQQPALIVEALAMASIHDSADEAQVLEPMEAAARSHQYASKPPVSLATLLRDLRANTTVINSALWTDSQKLIDGVVGRAGADLTAIGARYTVAPADLPARTHEMLQFVALLTAASQRPPHVHRLDFFVMHTLTPAIFFRALCMPNPCSPWDFLDDAARCRLLEWKVRRSMAEYVARGAPALHIDDVAAYKPAGPKAANDAAAWAGLFRRACAFDDDGHTAKVVRSLACGDALAGTPSPFEELFPRELWLRAAHMTIDSVDGSVTGDGSAPTMTKWVRGAGFEEAWKGVPLRAEARM